MRDDTILTRQDRWSLLHKRFRDYLLVARAYQSTRSRYEDMSDVGWIPLEGGQNVMKSAVNDLERVKQASWHLLGERLMGTPFEDWSDAVRGLSLSQIGLISGSYATCYLPKEEGEEPMGVPSVRSAWAYHGLHVVNGEAPSYTRGEMAGFDRDVKAKLIHRVGGMLIYHDNYYKERYDERRARTESNPEEADTDWDSEPDAHKHEDALRIMTKEVIKDWWRVLHGQPSHARLAQEEEEAA